MRTRTRKRLVAHISPVGMQEDWSREELQWLFSRVTRFDPRKSRNIDLPDRRREVAWIAIRLVSLLPSEETRLMLPHVVRMGQHGLVLHPDDLLVNQNAAIT